MPEAITHTRAQNKVGIAEAMQTRIHRAPRPQFLLSRKTRKAPLLLNGVLANQRRLEEGYKVLKRFLELIKLQCYRPLVPAIQPEVIKTMHQADHFPRHLNPHFAGEVC